VERGESFGGEGNEVGGSSSGGLVSNQLSSVSTGPAVLQSLTAEASFAVGSGVSNRCSQQLSSAARPVSCADRS